MQPLFVPRDYQKEPISYLLKGGLRGCLVWHRRSGKDLTLWNATWVLSQQRVGAYYYFYPTYAQAKKAVWFGMDSRGTRFMDYIPKNLIEGTHDTDMRIRFKNGSIIQLIGSDNIDTIMSTNPIGCVFSEYSLQDPRGWDFVRPILAENGGWSMFAYTPRGRNHGYELYNNTKGLTNWYSSLLTIEDTKAVPLSILEDERASGMPEELIQQEYYCSFSQTVVGSYFGTQLMQLEEAGRFKDIPYDPRLPVHTAWDFGVNDWTVVWFFQTDGKAVWLIDFYRNRNEFFPHYAEVLRQKGYVYGTHLGPHDSEQRHFGATGTVSEVAAEYGVVLTTVPRVSHKPDAIHSGHMLIPRCYFDKTNCGEGFIGLREYQREWDSNGKTHKNTPKHDWASDIADAFLTLSMGFDLVHVGYEEMQTHSSGAAFNPRGYESPSTYQAFDPRNKISQVTSTGNDYFKR